ncbi:hypothetical protein BC831DRAFT_307002 [Entophlyctis helioformis]|nr:hypothetical protein BC831DRAFT_307002 [Entophlyctis helioformis]
MNALDAMQPTVLFEIVRSASAADGPAAVATAAVAAMGPRRGRLRVRTAVLETPCSIRYTRQGCVPHIVDAASTLGLQPPHGLAVAMEQFVDLAMSRDEQRSRRSTRQSPVKSASASASVCASSAPVAQPDDEHPPHQSTPSLHEHLSVPKPSHILIGIPHDITRLASFSLTDAPTPKGGKRRWITTSNTAVGLMTNGNVESKISVKAYTEVLCAVQPDIVVSLSDPGQALFDAGHPVASATSSFSNQENAAVNGSGAAASLAGRSSADPAVVHQKQIRKRSERNLAFLASFISELSGNSQPSSKIRQQRQPEQHQQSLEAGGLATQKEAKSPVFPVFASLGGDHDLPERRFFAEQVVSRIPSTSLAGVAIHLPPPSIAAKHGHASVAPYLLSSLEPLPRSLPVLALGISRLEDMVAAVASGVDLIDDSWVYDLTNKGLALIASFDSPISLGDHGLPEASIPSSLPSRASASSRLSGPPSKKPAVSRKSSTSAVGKRDLAKNSSASIVTLTPAAAHTPLSSPSSSANLGPTNMSIWRSDLRPLSPHCGCWACKQQPHSRAYIHHLLTVDDMLASVLLMHHNIWQMNAFIGQMRDRLADGTFNECSRAFVG